MNLPIEVDVGPFIYTVTEDPTVLDAEAERRGVELFAFIDLAALLIGIEPGQAEASKRESLLHECLHAMAAVTGLDQEIEADKMESIVRRLSPLLLDVLRSNPDLVAYLVEP